MRQFHCNLYFLPPSRANQLLKPILTINPNDRIIFSKAFSTLCLKMQRLQSLPEPKDISRFLHAAREAVENRYREPRYTYVREALLKVFENCTEWLDDGLEPSIVLLEALQDERAILNRHNRIFAAAHSQQGNLESIPGQLTDFPLRFVCLQNGDFKLPSGIFEPIYQGGPFESPTPTSSTLPAPKGEYSFGKLSDAPSPTHSFPDANITLAEITTFVPQSIKSWDVADRVIWNGATSDDLTLMFNRYRGLDPKIDINSVYLMIRGQMRKRSEAEHGYKHWKQWIVSAQSDVKKSKNFNPESISVKGFRRPVIFKNRPNVPANPIPFKDLANGVAVWPEGDDALDLTRCVRWCVDNPEVEYFYPSDYQAVLERVGGPQPPGAHHSDGQSLARLRSTKGRFAPRHRERKDYRHDVAGSSERNDATTLGKRKRGLSPRSKRATRARSTEPSPLRRTRTMHNTTARKFTQRSLVDDSNEEGDTDEEAYQGPKRTKKSTDAPRRSERTRTQTTSYIDIDDDFVDERDNESHDEEDYENGNIEAV